MTTAEWEKTHKSALVIIPPKETWNSIQQLRQRFDRGFARWMPHLTMLYPFATENRLGEAADHLSSVLRGERRFEIRLEGVSHFAHRGGRFTFWLGPRDTEPVTRLHGKLVKALPSFDDTSSGPKGFVPHLTLGQAEGRGQLAARQQLANASLTPVVFPVENLAIVTRDENGPFSVFKELRLGS
ncbi:MAG: 2'-5' RNA ligase family protein [Myxococcales bacterium]|nr:2'-5' RNA ligase family protein [Myxococcales bacterium]